MVKAGGKATAFAVDVANSAQVARHAERSRRNSGGWMCWSIMRAMTRDQLLLRMTDEDWDAVLNTNLKGAFHFTGR